MDIKLANNSFNEAIFEYVRNTQIPNSAPLYKYAELYGTNELIYTLLDFKASKASQIKPMFFKAKDKGALKQFKSFNGKWQDTYEYNLYKDAKTRIGDEIYLDDISVTDSYFRLKSLFTKPNQWNSFPEFIYALCAYYDISGWGCIYQQKVKEQATQMFALPTHKMVIEGGTPFDPIKGYKLEAYYKKEFLPEDCISFRSFTTNIDKFGSHLYGQSKIGVAYSEITNYLEAKAREYTALKTGDSAHLLFPKHIDAQAAIGSDPSMVQKIKDSIFKALRQKDRHQAAVVGIDLGHINLASALKEANTGEIKKDIKENLASIFHMASRVVFNSSDSSTYNNLKEDRKSTLHNGVFPFLNMIERELSDNIVKPQFGLDLIFDYDVYPELNPDTLVEMEQMSRVTFLSDNEKRKWFDYDEIKGGDMTETSKSVTVQPLNFDYDNY